MKLDEASQVKKKKTGQDFLKCVKKTKPSNRLRGLKESHGSSGVRDRLLGYGCSGFVFLAKTTAPPPTDQDSDHLPAEMAVKSVFMHFSSPLQDEKEILCNLPPCTNVVRYYGHETTTIKSGGKVFNILLEYCSGSNLKKHILKFGPNGLPESEVRRYTRDIVRGLYHIHCNARYIHCDIKPDNILLSPTGGREADDGGCLVAKIADFGSAKKLTPDVSRDYRGSRLYMSPEAVEDGYLDWPADIWAVGCVVLEMLTGREAQRVSSDHKLPEIPEQISGAGRDFIRKCLVISPYKRRPTWLLIKHPFVSF